MVRAAILVTVLAVLANAQCFGNCVTNSCAQPAGSCHHNQKKTIEPCGHRPLIADDAAQLDRSPLTTPIPFAAAAPDPPTASSIGLAAPALAPSPPLYASSVTILKI